VFLIKKIVLVLDEKTQPCWLNRSGKGNTLLEVLVENLLERSGRFDEWFRGVRACVCTKRIYL